MMTKTFQHKGQMINYFNKMKNNANIDFCMTCFDCELGAYAIHYTYKKN